MGSSSGGATSSGSALKRLLAVACARSGAWRVVLILSWRFCALTGQMETSCDLPALFLQEIVFFYSRSGRHDPGLDSQ